MTRSAGSLQRGYEFDSLQDHPLTPMKSVKKLFRGR
jgi:hypothetical protein